MVVISEDDVICRSCATHINTLDRLEMETRNVRDHILRFLERKYCLEEGELLNNSNRPRLSQPPQITKSNTMEIIGNCISQSEVDSEMYSYNRNQQQQHLKQSHSCLQCDKCKYTTQLNSFMMYHMRNHLEQKIFCDKYGWHVPGGQEEKLQNCRTVVEQPGSKYEKGWVLEEERERDRTISHCDNCVGSLQNTVNTLQIILRLTVTIR